MPLTIANLYPLETDPQGDEGNALVLAHRAEVRGITATVITVHSGPLPAADIYVLGGLIRSGHRRVVSALRGRLASYVGSGSVVFGVNAGLQLLGEWFTTPDGTQHDGAGLIDVRSFASGPVDGPVITWPNASLGLPAMSGYESHRSGTELGDGVTPLAALELGTGNGGVPAEDGAVCRIGKGRVIGTYLHGPVLVRNPELADALISCAIRRPIPPLRVSFGEKAREQRIAQDRADPTGWARSHMH